MIVRKNIIEDIGRLFFWYPFRYLVQILPLILVYCLGGVLGKIDYYVSGRKRIWKTRKNVSIALKINEKEADKIVRKSLQNHLRNMLEFMRYHQLNNHQLSSIVEYEGLDFLNTALSNGKGVILLTAHFGAKQLLQVALGHKEYALNQINFHMDGKELTNIQRRVSQKQRKNIEEKIPVTFISAKGFMGPVYKCLKNNEVLIIAGDGIGLKRHMDISSYQPFNFLGKKMMFPVNYLNLAKKTGAQIVPVFVLREKTNHRIVFEPALNINSEKNIEGINVFILSLEKKIVKYPFLWEFWEEFDENNLLVPS
jgi:KDO2-lipid IV(A) lauroyltransferase